MLTRKVPTGARLRSVCLALAVLCVAASAARAGGGTDAWGTPADWELRASAVCGVSVPVPPTPPELAAQLAAGQFPLQEYWQFSEGSGGAALGLPLFPNAVGARAAYDSSLYAEGILSGGGRPGPGFVEVGCAPNVAGHTNETIVGALLSSVDAPEFALEQARSTIAWGRPVVAARFRCAMCWPDEELFLFATRAELFVARRRVYEHGRGTPVEDEAERIFRNLQFHG